MVLKKYQGRIKEFGSYVSNHGSIMDNVYSCLLYKSISYYVRKCSQETMPILKLLVVIFYDGLEHALLN